MVIRDLRLLRIDKDLVYSRGTSNKSQVLIHHGHPKSQVWLRLNHHELAHLSPSETRTACCVATPPYPAKPMAADAKGLLFFLFLLIVLHLFLSLFLAPHLLHPTGDSRVSLLSSASLLVHFQAMIEQVDGFFEVQSYEYRTSTCNRIEDIL